MTVPNAGGVEISGYPLDVLYDNRGAAGVDGQSIADFEADLSNNLYKLWNRLSSGSYFPSPVRRVDIPKADSGTRPFGHGKAHRGAMAISCPGRLTATALPKPIAARIRPQAFRNDDGGRRVAGKRQSYPHPADR